MTADMTTTLAPKECSSEKLTVEITAKFIFENLMPYDGPKGTEKPGWVKNGNSLKQGEAREHARAILGLLRRPSPSAAVEVVEKRIEKMRPIVHAMPNNEAASAELETYLSLQRELRALPQQPSDGFAAGVAACVGEIEAQRQNYTNVACGEEGPFTTDYAAGMNEGGIRALTDARRNLSQLSPTQPEDKGLREALTSLLKTAKLLYQNAEGCAVNHHALDYHEQGLPGWLADCLSDIAEAEKALALSAQEKQP
ncbi:hypothetical protein [Pelagibius sp.]|uniref:hypothetical protein n=1 Tax=Pelagibius sp. TaxID=1931238 RepID=UPI003BAE706F